MKEFKRLAVWEKAHALTLAIYRATAAFPKEERYGLTSQMRRCSASVAANIAEGCGRTGNGEFHRFLNMAAGSCFELEYFVLLSHDLGFLSPQLHHALTADTHEVQRMLASLLRKVESSRRERASM
ncbi:MAG TPA: four helix bundle protein [Terriglobales bacterium]|jgi:four helix bundle protein|nr:four helix bundle protein [Terriglobales bacterium]